MSASGPSAAVVEQHIRRYIQAKDENRPHLMEQVFAPGAELEMVVRSDAITFPPRVSGLPAITDVLVRQFGRTYENVYTFCLQRPTAGAAHPRFSCGWFVAMSSKEGGALRVGRGCYDWFFGREAPHLVERLRITIDAMQVFPSERQDAAFRWTGELGYPWTSAEALRRLAPSGMEAV